jgi:hypothetical protein
VVRWSVRRNWVNFLAKHFLNQSMLSHFKMHLQICPNVLKVFLWDWKWFFSPKLNDKLSDNISDLCVTVLYKIVELHFNVLFVQILDLNKLKKSTNRNIWLLQALYKKTLFHPLTHPSIQASNSLKTLDLTFKYSHKFFRLL